MAGLPTGSPQKRYAGVWTSNTVDLALFGKHRLENTQSMLATAKNLWPDGVWNGARSEPE